MKICSECRLEKALDAFSKNAKRIDGLGVWCRSCCRAYRLKNVEHEKERSRLYFQANREASRLRGKKHIEKNRERLSARTKAYIAANKTARLAYQKNWSVANPAKVTANCGARRARKMNATPLWLNAIQKAQVQEFYEIAKALTAQTGIAHEVDHVHALKGKNFRGLHVPWNLQVLTQKENATKYNSLIGLNV